MGDPPIAFADQRVFSVLCICGGKRKEKRKSRRGSIWRGRLI